MHATKLICPPLQGLMLMDGSYLRNMSCIQKKMNCLFHQAGKVSTKDEIFIAVSVTHSSSEVNALNAQRQILTLRLHVSATQSFNGFLLRSRSRVSNKSYRLNLILIYES